MTLIAPGISKRVAEALLGASERLGPHSVRVILDIDAQVYRLGYGEFSATQFLHDKAGDLGPALLETSGLRVGALLTDQAILVYAPTPLLVEDNNAKTNGIRIVQSPVVQQALPVDPYAAHIPQTPVAQQEPPTEPHGVPDAQKPAVQQEPLSESQRTLEPEPRVVSQKQIEKVRHDLQKNPPVDFRRSRQVARFNQHFQFVEFELRGLQISRKTVRIRSDLLGLTKDSQIQRLLRTTYRLISEDSGLSGQPIMELKRYIQEKYLISLTGYGTIVLRDNKKRFEDAVRGLESCIACFQKKVREKLQEQINKNRAALVKALLPNVRKNPPTRWQRYLGEPSSPEAVRRLLERELSEAFGNAEDILRGMKLKKVFKNVSDELLNDREFLRTVRKAVPTLDVLDEELAEIPLPEGASGASAGRSWRP